jgi:hypothetical protein
MLPDPYRPDLPAPLNSGWERWRLATDEPRDFRLGTHIASEMEHVRLAQDVRTMAADPAVTRETLDAELRAIVAKPDADVTLADVERISLMARLPNAKRPPIIDRAYTYGWLPVSKMSSWGYTPTTEGAVRGTWDSLRRLALEEQLLADPSFTRQMAEDELLGLLAKPATQLTTDELVRVNAIAGLPEHLRPSLPPSPDTDIVIGAGTNVVRPDGVRASRAFETLRNHVAERNPEAMARRLVELDHTGEAIDLGLVAVLAKTPGLLDQVGIDAELLHRQSIGALAAAGGDRGADLAANLRIARNVIDQHPAADGSVAQLKDEAIELADRNLARMSGERTDTYGRHPDYAEVGRVASIATLLHEMRKLAAAKAAAAAEARATGAGAGAGEVLTW